MFPKIIFYDLDVFESIQNQKTLQIRKRILKYEEATADCDIMLIVRGSSNLAYHGKISELYNCSNDANETHPNKNYECMVYAILKNSHCKGFLFSSARNNERLEVDNVLQSERNKIWYGKRNNTQQVKDSFHDKQFSSNEIRICKMVFQELAQLHHGGFEIYDYKKHLNTSWQRPWNTEIALNALLWNGKGKFRCFNEEVEMFYVPFMYRERFLSVASVFIKLKIPDIIAVPMILKSLDLESTFVQISPGSS